jgi:hypothetical protein
MTTLPQSQSRSTNPLLLSGLLGWIAALTGSLAVAGVAALLGIQLQIAVAPNMQTAIPLTLLPILFATLIPSVGATVLFGLLNRFAGKNAPRIFQIIALVLMVLSLGAPFGLPVAGSVKIFLAVMHIVAGGALIWALTLRGNKSS